MSKLAKKTIDARLLLTIELRETKKPDYLFEETLQSKIEEMEESC
jgi:hypothetical protein